MGDGIRGFGGVRRAELSPTSQGMPMASWSDTELTFGKGSHEPLNWGARSGLITVSKVVLRACSERPLPYPVPPAALVAVLEIHGGRAYPRLKICLLRMRRISFRGSSTVIRSITS